MPSLSQIYTHFRLPNLLIVAVTMLVFAFGILYPSLNAYDIVPILWLKDLYLLVFITISLAAFGYLHNDLQDLTADHINKGSSITRIISKTSLVAILLFFALAPALLAFSLALEIEKPAFVSIYFVVLLVIYVYNRWLKRYPLIGNIIVASLCAGVLGVLLLAERESLILLRAANSPSFYNVVITAFWYMAFAFMTTLVRELVKDVEDMNGDIQAGYGTWPVKFGVRSTQILLIGIWVMLMLGILAGWYVHFFNLVNIWWFSVLLILPAIFILFCFFQLKEKSDYTRISSMIKYYMISGLIFLLYLKSHI